MKSVKKLIIVLPCYNEGEALLHTIDALVKIRQQIVPKYQLDIMFVNDGSADDTQQVINRAAEKHDFIYYREFAHNAGHQSALRAGLNAAVGYDATIMMDADLQPPPEQIPKMIEAWEAGAKVVQMTRDDSTKDVSFFKYYTSVAYYKFINWISDLSLEYGASDFRLIDKTVTETVAKSPENNLFLRGYFSWLKVPRATIAYHPNQRVAGVSKYSLKKLLDLAYKGILQFSEKPLRLSVGLGIVFALAAILYGIVLTVMYFAGDHPVDGWTSLMVALLFCFGINFILLGIIGTYMAHSISIQKERPEFVIATQKIPKL
jgi:glycosyltransferase involved in cell wall biosynthesis